MRSRSVITIILVVVLAGGGFLVWDYLFRYDDKQDFQGQWKIEGTNTLIVITDSEIKLTDSVSFGYELDTFAKTIKYTYVNYANEGSYVFSPERDVLTITDVDPEAHRRREPIDAAVEGLESIDGRTRNRQQ